MRKIFLEILIAGLVFVSYPVYSQQDEERFDSVEYDIDEAQHEKGEREVVLRLTPGVGYIFKFDRRDDPLVNQLGLTQSSVRPFLYIMINPEADVQIYKNWFVTGSFLYAHSNYKQPLSGDLDIYGVPIGIRYVLLESDYKPEAASFLDYSRYWAAIAVGPFITAQSVKLGAVNGTRSTIDFGARGSIGFDYFFRPEVGIGLQFNLYYVHYDNNYLMITVGPSLLGRF